MTWAPPWPLVLFLVAPNSHDPTVVPHQPAHLLSASSRHASRDWVVPTRPDSGNSSRRDECKNARRAEKAQRPRRESARTGSPECREHLPARLLGACCSRAQKVAICQWSEALQWLACACPAPVDEERASSTQKVSRTPAGPPALKLRGDLLAGQCHSFKNFFRTECWLLIRLLGGLLVFQFTLPFFRRRTVLMSHRNSTGLRSGTPSTNTHNLGEKSVGEVYNRLSKIC